MHNYYLWDSLVTDDEWEIVHVNIYKTNLI